ncbi:hypothetical protein NK6_5707 [Bradyrhizobium diazoefficiens]|uniref:Uncharacterized protein n=1 Tax=Bradyrhizobium diazoefficiens TaxID=1355477 RepID=A0A0E4BRD9_9BRAD|nr:hypothetical protein NK6_5707 [Bradyrhizobium diazoefficiens]
MSCWRGAHCAPKPHIADPRKNGSTNNPPTEPHIAAFYLAIVRSVLAAICDRVGSLR